MGRDTGGYTIVSKPVETKPSFGISDMVKTAVAGASKAAKTVVTAPNLPDTNNPTSGGGDGGSGGGGSSQRDQPGVDWADLFWGSLGIPSDVASQINSIFSKYPDATMAQTIAFNYIQTTGWFNSTFPGYGAGLQAGLYSDLNGYRSYVNEMNRISKQYTGNAVSTADVLSNLQQGFDPSIYEKNFQAQSFINANRSDIQYQEGAFGNGVGQGPGGQLSADQLQALGKQQVGLNNPLGEQLQSALQKASQRMQKVFQGTLAHPAGLTLGQQGLNAPGLLGAKQPSSASGNSDVAA